MLILELSSFYPSICLSVDLSANYREKANEQNILFSITAVVVDDLTGADPSNSNQLLSVL